MNKTRKLTTIQILYLLIFSLALLLRLVNLGTAALSENEAHQVLCTVEWERAGCEGDSALYRFFTNILFQVFGQSNYASRLLPALAGSLVVLLPMFLQNTFGNKKTGLVLALCLALDPILIQVSRSADATMIAVAFLLYVTVFLVKRDYRTAFFLFLFGMLSGPAFWLGSALLLGSYGIARYRMLKKGKENRKVFPETCPFNWIKGNQLEGLVLVVLWAAVSTRFFTFPAGFLAPVQSVAALITGTWQAGTGMAIPTGIKAIGLVLYSAFGICLCVSAVIKSKDEQSENQMFLILWLVLALVVLLLPDMPFSQSVWMLFPLWFLAAGEIVHLVEQLFAERKNLLIPSLIGLVIVIYLSLQIVRLRYLLSVGLSFQQNIYLLIIPLLLVVVFVLLYAYGWSRKLAGQVVTVLFLVCGFFGLWRNANRAANLTGTVEYELLQQGGFIHNADVLINEMEQYRISKGAFSEDIAIGVSSSDRMESMEWLLRDYNVTALASQPQTNSAEYDVIIVEGDVEQDYEGYYKQSLALRSTSKFFKSDYSGFLPREILEWLIYRGGALELENYTLWFKF